MKLQFVYQFLVPAIVSIFALTSCTVNIDEYRKVNPRLTMEGYFNGPLQAWGMVQNFSGKVIRRFHVEMTGTWKGDKGILDEYFQYSDGETQRRVWSLTKHDDNRYSGVADDIVGVANGVAQGNALRWSYVMELPVDDTTYHIKFDDWMYRINDDIVINRSLMKKFGVSVGEVTIIFQRGKSGHTAESIAAEKTSIDAN